MKKFLVVDDSKAIRSVARLILEQLEFEIIESEDGGSALDQCRRHMPDGILLDWYAPVVGGLDFVRNLREAEGGKRPIVIVSAGERNIDDIAAALKAGANEFILKPFDRESLTTKLGDVGLL